MLSEFLQKLMDLMRTQTEDERLAIGKEWITRTSELGEEPLDVYNAIHYRLIMAYLKSYNLAYRDFQKAEPTFIRVTGNYDLHHVERWAWLTTHLGVDAAIGNYHAIEWGREPSKDKGWSKRPTAVLSFI